MARVKDSKIHFVVMVTFYTNIVWCVSTPCNTSGSATRSIDDKYENATLANARFKAGSLKGQQRVRRLLEDRVVRMIKQRALGNVSVPNSTVQVPLNNISHLQGTTEPTTSRPMQSETSKRIHITVSIVIICVLISAVAFGVGHTDRTYSQDAEVNSNTAYRIVQMHDL